MRKNKFFYKTCVIITFVTIMCRTSSHMVYAAADDYEEVMTESSSVDDADVNSIKIVSAGGDTKENSTEDASSDDSGEETESAQENLMKEAVSLNQSAITYANETKQHKDLRTHLEQASQILGKYIRDQYNGCMVNTEKAAEKNGWDKDYTMMSFGDRDAPYADIDCNEIIAAYTAALDAGKTKDSMLSDIPLITCKVTPEQVPGDDSSVYGKVEFQITDLNKIYEYLGIGNDSEEDKTIRKEAESREKILDEITDGKQTAQSELLVLPENNSTENNIEDAGQSEATDGAETNTENSASFRIPDSGDTPLVNFNSLTGDRKIVVATALSLVGKIPYEWGGKPFASGYDPTWWTIGANGKQHGLDCSGFVQWTFMTAGYGKDITDHLLSTITIRHSLEDISEDELLPGDIGLLNNTDSSLNHTGIYLGNGQWVHCSSSKNTVTVSNFQFKYFKRMPELDDSSYLHNDDGEIIGIISDNGKVISADDAGISEYTGLTSNMIQALVEKQQTVEQLYSSLQAQGIDFSITPDDQTKTTTDENSSDNNDAAAIQKSEITFGDLTNWSYSATDQNEDDIMLIAKLVEHEAGNQGFNGWAAVAEVVKNRIESSLFPDTASEVIYQQGQFTNSDALSGITPREEVLQCVRQVMSGNISVLGNKNVLYFRNPSYAGLKASDEVNWGPHTWYTSINQHAFYLQ